MRFPSTPSPLRARREPILIVLLLLAAALFPYPVEAHLDDDLPAYAHPTVAAATTEPEPAREVRGVASWYGNPRVYGAPAIAWYTRTTRYGAPITFYAAAGPALRDLLGDANPYHEHYPVTVTNPRTGISIPVVVTDWCGCSSGSDREKLIDLSPAAFKALGIPLTRGIQPVIVTLGHPPIIEPARPAAPRELPPDVTPSGGAFSYPL